MQNVVHAVAGLVQGVEVEQVGFVELDLVQYFSQVFALAGGKIVQSAEFFAASAAPGQGGPDEARNAGNEVNSPAGISIIQDRLRGISGLGTRE